MEAKDTIQLIKTRRSIRAFLDKPIPKDTMDEIMNAAVLSPSSHNCQAVHYVIVQNKEMIKELKEVCQKALGDGVWGEGYKKFASNAIFYDAPGVILLFAAKQKDHFTDINVGIASQSIMLYAHSAGLGTTYIGLAEVLNFSPETLKKLNIPDDLECMGGICIGYPDPEKCPKIDPKRDAPKIISRFE